MYHKAKVSSAGIRYDGVRLWQWFCPRWDHGWNRNCRGNTYGTWEKAVKNAIKHAVTQAGTATHKKVTKK